MIDGGIGGREAAAHHFLANEILVARRKGGDVEADLIAGKADAALEAFAAFGVEIGVRRRRIAEGEIFEELVDLPRLGRLEAGRIIGEQPDGVGDLPQSAELGRQPRAVLPGTAERRKQRVVIGRQIVPVKA